MHKKQRLTSSDVGRFLCVRNFYEYCRHAVAMGRIAVVVAIMLAIDLLLQGRRGAMP